MRHRTPDPFPLPADVPKEHGQELVSGRNCRPAERFRCHQAARQSGYIEGIQWTDRKDNRSGQQGFCQYRDARIGQEAAKKLNLLRQVLQQHSGRFPAADATGHCPYAKSLFKEVHGRTPNVTTGTLSRVVFPKSDGLKQKVVPSGGQVVSFPGLIDPNEVASAGFRFIQSEVCLFDQFAG